ncbi:YceI family protein [Pareuzebyella sediminis]|uniref:YceI family protein n=1 Tax=Pareuzebyella sediminis TaxID=2607998 RepID=UPI0018E0CC27|nr:YceI family protein [Pareuzebyella sediminis]
MEKLTTIFLTSVTGLLMTFNVAVAQNNNIQTHISYQVNMGPVYPINGDNYQIMGKVTFNDETNALEDISFDVPLNSFNGQNAGYLAWVANSWNNPNMEFTSNSIMDKGDGKLIIKGDLKLRRRFSSIKINMERRDIDNKIVLEGDFTLNTNDFFIVPPSNTLVPTWIPFRLTLVFDKPSKNDKQISLY